MVYEVYLFLFSLFIFFNVSYQTFFGLFCGYNMLLFYRKNRNLIMNDTTSINVCLFYLMVILDGIILYFWLINIYLHKYKIYKDVIYYSNKINSLFLETSTYISNSLFNYFQNSPKENNKKANDNIKTYIQNQKNETDALNFLEKLKKC